MNAQYLMYAIGRISDRHVAEFAYVQPVIVKKPSVRRKVLLAACIIAAAALAAMSAFAVYTALNSGPMGSRETPLPVLTPAPEPTPEPIELIPIEGVERDYMKNDVTYFRNNSAPETTETDIMGFPWPGTYFRSCKAIRSYRPDFDGYISKEKGNSTDADWFVNPVSGKIVSFSIHWGEDHPGTGDPLSETKCRETAEELARQKAEGLACDILLLGKKEKADSYEYEFSVSIGGVPMHQNVTVTVDVYGRITGFNGFILEDFIGIDGERLGKLIAGLDDERALRAKADSICGGSGLKSFAIAEKTLYRMKDGVCGILYKLDVTPAGREGEQQSVWLYRPLDF